MGSQLTKSYDVESNIRAAGGLQGVWKIYSATKKDKSRQRVSIFMFDKRLIEKKKSAAERDDLVQKLKNEVSALVRIRHPCILRVVEPLLEDSKTLAFVTEHVEGCLGDFIRKPVVLASEFSDMESRLGLLDLAQALHFLHSEARMVHTAVCPDNVYVVEGGKWKLSGLGFSLQLLQDQTARVPDQIDYIMGAKSQRFAEGEVPAALIPPLHFMAPEVVTTRICTSASDMFSLGCLIYSLYKAASSSSSVDHHYLRITDISANGHKNACTEAQYSIGTLVAAMPEDFREVIARLAALAPTDRPTIHAFSVSRPFQDPFIKSLYFLEHIHEKQESQKVQFLKGMSRVIEKFDPRLLLKRVLPTLVQLMEQDTLSASVLPNLLGILRYSKVPSDQFRDLIWPGIVKLATGKEIPAQCLFLLLGDMDLLMSFTAIDQYKTVLMPLVFKGYDCGVAQLQELVLRKTPEIASRVSDTSYLKVQILPRFLQALIAARVVSVREAGLRSLSKIYQFFDRSTLVDTVLPMLEKVRKLDVSSEICMLLLEVYEGIGKMLGHRTVALNILPSLIPLLVESDLTKAEFDKLCSTIDSLTALVREARTQELLTIKEVDQKPRLDPVSDFGAPAKEDESADTFFKEMFSGASGGEDQGGLFAGMEVREDSRARQQDFQQPYSQPFPGSFPQPVTAPMPPARGQFLQTAFPPSISPLQAPPMPVSTAFGDPFSQTAVSFPAPHDSFPMSAAPIDLSMGGLGDRAKTPPPLRALRPPTTNPKPIPEPAPSFNPAFQPLTLAQPTPIWSPPSYNTPQAVPDLFGEPQQVGQGRRNNPFATSQQSVAPQSKSTPYPADPFFGL